MKDFSRLNLSMLQKICGIRRRGRCCDGTTNATSAGYSDGDERYRGRQRYKPPRLQ